MPVHGKCQQPRSRVFLVLRKSQQPRSRVFWCSSQKATETHRHAQPRTMRTSLSQKATETHRGSQNGDEGGYGGKWAERHPRPRTPPTPPIQEPRPGSPSWGRGRVRGHRGRKAPQTPHPPTPPTQEPHTHTHPRFHPHSRPGRADVEAVGARSGQGSASVQHKARNGLSEVKVGKEGSIQRKWI